MCKRLHLQNIKIKFYYLLSLFACISFANSTGKPIPSGVIYQVMPIAALAKGIYADKFYTYGELKKHGDFGLGTFLNVDGEMIALGGKFYQMMADGRVRLVNDKQWVPFAEVSYFKPTIRKVSLQPATNFNDMTSELLKFFKNKNVPYAIRIDGTFSSLKLRAVRKQDIPFKSLAIVTKNQAIFNLTNVKGTLIGYWFPDYLSGVAVTGFHLHFIDSAHTIGGHVLDLNMSAHCQVSCKNFL
ncbi:MAG TPA: acetolactate decarboxylase [Aquella sp.]|nr:acetolactate decarboxylase [Aquella sp.]